MYPSNSPELGTKLEGLEPHRHWTRSISSFDICAYSDGSSEGIGRSSWGFFLQRGGKTFEHGNGTLHGAEVFDAEIMGATYALLATLRTRQGTEKIYVLLDNQAAVGALQTGRTSSCLRLTRNFHEVAQKADIEVR